MNEPACTLTDYVLTIECAAFSLLLLAQSQRPDVVARAGASFFASISLCSLAGGTLHGFFADSNSTAHKLLWALTLASLGCAAASAWITASYLLLSASAAKRVTIAALLELVAFVPCSLLFGGAFALAIINYLPAMIFMFIAAVVGYSRSRTRMALIGSAGILLTFVASYVQMAQIAFHPHYFDHNALYHFIQATGLFMIFWWLSRNSYSKKVLQT